MVPRRTRPRKQRLRRVSNPGVYLACRAKTLRDTRPPEAHTHAPALRRLLGTQPQASEQKGGRQLQRGLVGWQAQGDSQAGRAALRETRGQKDPGPQETRASRCTHGTGATRRGPSEGRVGLLSSW